MRRRQERPRRTGGGLPGLLGACALVFASVLALGLAAPEWLNAAPPPMAQLAVGQRVEGAVRVIDGDTVHLASGERLRISNIDTPEMPPRSQCGGEAALARAATANLSAMVARADEVRLVADIGRTHDRYGRRLGRLVIDGVDVGEAQIAAGLAERWQGHRAAWCG